MADDTSFLLHFFLVYNSYVQLLSLFLTVYGNLSDCWDILAPSVHNLNVSINGTEISICF